MGASGTSLQIVTALDEVRRASAGVHVRACLPSAQRSGVRCVGVYRVILGYSAMLRDLGTATAAPRLLPRNAARTSCAAPRGGSSRADRAAWDFHRAAWLTRQVAWLLNVRGSDVEGNPVVVSYATVNVHGSVRWYIDRCAAAYPAQTRPSEPADGH